MGDERIRNASKVGGKSDADEVKRDLSSRWVACNWQGQDRQEPCQQHATHPISPPFHRGKTKSDLKGSSFPQRQNQKRPQKMNIRNASPSSTPSPAPLKCPQRSDHATATPPRCVENWPTPPATRNLHHASRSPRAASARAHQRYQHASVQPWRPRFVARRAACDSLQRLASLQPLRAMPRAAETRAAN